MRFKTFATTGFNLCIIPLLHLEETYIKVKGKWEYLYRAVDFLLRAHRDQAAAHRFFEQAIEQNGAPERVTIDKSGSTVAALDAINDGRRKRIVVRQVKYLNNIVEQDHRAIRRRTRPMLGFTDFSCARILLSGIELMHMISKGTYPRTAFLLPGSIDSWTIPAIHRSRFLIATEPSDSPREKELISFSCQRISAY